MRVVGEIAVAYGSGGRCARFYVDGGETGRGLRDGALVVIRTADEMLEVDDGRGLIAV